MRQAAQQLKTSNRIHEQNKGRQGPIFHNAKRLYNSKLTTQNASESPIYIAYHRYKIEDQGGTSPFGTGSHQSQSYRFDGFVGPALPMPSWGTRTRSDL